MFRNTPSLSRTRQLPNQVILIYKYPGKPPKKSRKNPQTYSFSFLTYCRYSSFFSLSFPFYIRDDQSPKNSDGSTKELTINFPMITYWVVRATSLYHIKKWTSYPLYMALSYNPYGLCISFVNPKSRINTCQSSVLACVKITCFAPVANFYISIAHLTPEELREGGTWSANYERWKPVK